MDDKLKLTLERIILLHGLYPLGYSPITEMIILIDYSFNINFFMVRLNTTI